MNMHATAFASRQIRSLIEENETLREEVRQLRGLLAPEPRAPKHWRLTRLQDRLLRALRGAGTGLLTRERAMAALYSDRDDPPDAKMIDVHLCLLRAKLRLCGLPVAVETLPLEGYRLTPEGLLALNAALSAESHALTTLAARAGEDGGRDA